MDNRVGLPRNAVLDGSYCVERVIGAGRFGLTYQARDLELGTTVAIKEYYPFGLSDRHEMSIRPASRRHRESFDRGRSHLLQQARILSRLEHPSIPRATRVFEAHSTAYLVMTFEEGKSFEAWLRELGRAPTQEELDRIVLPLLDAIEAIHAQNYLHRGIAPDNIIIRHNGTPVLVGFGSTQPMSREQSNEQSSWLESAINVLSPQRRRRRREGSQEGPCSDLYALGATLYVAVTGKPPAELALRVTDDRMPKAVEAAKGPFRASFLSAIDSCMKVHSSERPQSVALLRPMLPAE